MDNKENFIDTLRNFNVNYEANKLTNEAAIVIECLYAQLPKQGRWIEGLLTIQCSICGTKFDDEITCCRGYGWLWKYCPNCGAKMEASKDDQR